MKKRWSALILLSICFYSSLAADSPVFSGVFNSTLTAGAGKNEMPDFYWWLEEYANLRIKKGLGDYGNVNVAFNIIAAGGVSALGLNSQLAAASADGKYAAAIELERLYFHITGDKVSFDAGLMRLAFGYGSVFSPNDYFNPKNPLYPDARPRAVLAANLSVFPTDMSRLQLFAVAPENPYLFTGEGVSGGFAAENHWNKFSAQALYSFEVRKDSDSPNVHNAGFSLKADLPVGITADALWTHRQGEDATAEGLCASGAVDYTFSIGQTHTLYLACEYLYRGVLSKIEGYAKSHYLYGAATFSIDDYTSFSLGALAGLTDKSVVPLVSFNTDLFQGASLTLQAQVPLGEGELGSDAAGSYFAFTAKLGIKL